MSWLRQLFQRPSKSQREETISQEQIQIERQIFRERKNYIDDFIKQYTETEKQKQKDYIEKENKIAEICNSRCPKCKSHDIIHKYKTYKGETNTKINQCKSCGHEFEYKEQRYLWSDDYYYYKIDIKLNSYLFLTDISKALDELNNFNPNRLTEECNTIEEKKIQLCKRLKEHYIYVKIMNYPIEVIIYAALKEDFYKSPRCEQIINFGKYKYDADVRNYLAKLTPQAQDLMVNYLGFKYHFN